MEDELTSYNRVMTALNGQKPDRVPVIPIVREWCLEQVNFKFTDAMKYPEKYVYAQYYCLREFGYDALWDPLAIHAESGAMGSIVELVEGYPPKVTESAVKDYKEDLPKLKMPDPKSDGWLPHILEIHKQLKNLCQGEYPNIGYVQAPFRHAAMLRGADLIYKDVRKEPENLKKLLEIATESQIIWAKALIEAGSDIIFLADPTCSGDAVSVKVWEEFGAPYVKKVISAIKEDYPIKTILHICGDTNDRLESMYNTGVDCLSVDQKVDLVYARKVLGPKSCILGNVDPSALLGFGKPEEVGKRAKECISEAGENGAFILSSGCLTVNSPPENMKALVDVGTSYYY
jgi:MtaA/CmuA family methyltransferase